MSGTYRAIQLQRFAPSFREATGIVELPVEAPGPGEIRVSNHWTGVNGIFDTQLSRDAFDYLDIKPPTFMGVESVGIVDAIGAGVTEFAVGDAAAATRFPGGYREMHTAPASTFAKCPDASAETLALASTGVAALLVLETAGRLQDGETVAISAAAGGLGHLAVQIAKLRGCRVVAVCGGPDKAALVRSLGADRVIDYKSEDIATVLAAEFPNALDVAVDTVGGTVFDAFLDNLAPHGRLAVSGAASDMGDEPDAQVRPRLPLGFYYKSATIAAFQNGRVQRHWPEARARLFAMRERLTVICDKRFTGLASAYDAVEQLLSGQTQGKVVVDLTPRQA